MDTYRSPAQTLGAELTVIGRRNAFAQWTSIVIHTALIAGVVWVIAVWSWPLWLATIGVVLAMSLSQDLHALSLPVEFALTGAGMHIRHARRSGGLRMQRVDKFIPWSEVQGVRTHELRTNASAIVTLHIDTTSGTVSIEPDTFDAAADRLQTRILDHMHALGPAEQRDQAGIDEFCRARWAVPLRLTLRRERTQYLWIFVILWLPLAGLVYFARHLWPVWLGMAALYAFGIGSAVLAARRVRVLELRAGGLALGSAPDRLETIAWRDILLVRRTITTSDTQRKTTALDVRLRDGRSIVLNGSYGRSLDDLAELIDPPVQKLALARASMATGVDIETATRTAGLPARAPTDAS